MLTVADIGLRACAIVHAGSIPDWNGQVPLYLDLEKPWFLPLDLMVLATWRIAHQREVEMPAQEFMEFIEDCPVGMGVDASMNDLFSPVALQLVELLSQNIKRAPFELKLTLISGPYLEFENPTSCDLLSLHRFRPTRIKFASAVGELYGQMLASDAVVQGSYDMWRAQCTADAVAA